MAITHTDSKCKTSMVSAFPRHRTALNQRDQMTGSTMIGLSVAEKPTQLQSDNFMTCSYTLSGGRRVGQGGKDYT